MRKNGFEKLEYLEEGINEELEGRRVVLFPFLNSKGEWQIPFVRPPEEEIRLFNGIPSSSLYVAAEIQEQETDIFIPVLDFFYKHASFPRIVSSLDSLHNDFCGLIFSLAKVDSFHTCEIDTHWKSNFVKSEIEYVFILYKSMLDDIQILIAQFWNYNVKLKDDKIQKKNLPETYRKMIFHDRKKLSPEKIAEKFSIPLELAEFYHNSGSFFEKIKKIRDDIVHNGKSIDFIYTLEEGFAISKDTKLFSEMQCFDDENTKGNNLVSVRPFFYSIINESINLTTDFVNVISKTIDFPKSMIPHHNVYVRLPELKRYYNAKEELKENSWWS